MLDGWVVVVVALVCAPAYAVLRRRAGAATSSVWAEIAFGLYLSLLVATVFFPFRIDPGLRADDAVWDRAAFITRSVNLVPFASIGLTLAHPKRLGAVAQIGGNLALLAPLGLFVPLFWSSVRRWRRMAVLALTCAVAIEVAQLLLFWMRLSIRAIDVDDVILNVAGVLLGYAMWRARQRRTSSAQLRDRADGAR